MGTPGRRQSKRRRRVTAGAADATTHCPKPRKSLGCLLVHGIGHYESGDAISAIAEPILRAAPLVDIEVLTLPTARSPEGLDLYPYDMKAGHRSTEFVFAEANWSDTVDAAIRDVGRLRRAITFYTWILRGLPLMLSVVGPDMRDLRRQSVRKSADIATELPTAWRLVSAVFWTVSVGGLISLIARLLPVIWYAPSGICLVIAFVIVAGLRINVAEHVRMATTSHETRQALIDKVGGALDALEKSCDEVVVIAHSQGGYLAYGAIQARRESQKIKGLFAIGSGLRPITLLAELGGMRRAAAAWCGIIGVAMVVYGVWPIFDAYLRDGNMFVIRILRFVVELATIPLVFVIEVPRVMTHLVEWEDVVSGPLAAWHALLGLCAGRTAILIAGVGLWLLALQVSRVLGEVVLESPSVRRDFVWHEYSSAQDVVGRMVSPELPHGVDQPSIPSPGNPFRDHTLRSYMADSSSLPALLAIHLFGCAHIGGLPAHAALRAERCREAQDRVSTRLYWLRGLVTFEVIGVSAVMMMLNGSSAFYSVLALWAGFVPLALVLHVVFGCWTARRIRQTRGVLAAWDANPLSGSERDSNHPAFQIPVPRICRKGVERVGSAGLIALLAGIVGPSTLRQLHIPVDYSASGKLALCGLMLLAVTPAVALGYRISWWFIGAVVAIVAFGIVSSSHVQDLAGRLWTTQYLLAWMFAVVALVSLCSTRWSHKLRLGSWLRRHVLQRLRWW